MSLLRIKRDLRSFLDPAGKFNFIRTLPPGARILDVGSGNRSASLAKGYRPDLEYVGLDIDDYNITEADKELMAEYVVCSPEEFAWRIHSLSPAFDAVVSSHNLEHCQDPAAVLEAMSAVLKPGGRLYLSLPSEASASFPSRPGTLNFHDDPTHRTLFPFEELASALRSCNLRIERRVRRNRGRWHLLFLLGALQEPASRRHRQVLRGTWYFWGFESVFVARKV